MCFGPRKHEIGCSASFIGFIDGKINGSYAPEYEFFAASGWLWNFVDSLLAIAFDFGTVRADTLALIDPVPVSSHRVGSYSRPDSRYSVFASTIVGRPAFMKLPA